MNATEVLATDYDNVTVPIYITNGGAGNPGCGEPDVPKPLNISAKLAYEYGYGQWVLTNAIHAQLNFYLSENQTLHDQTSHR